MGPINEILSLVLYYYCPWHLVILITLCLLEMIPIVVCMYFLLYYLLGKSQQTLSRFVHLLFVTSLRMLNVLEGCFLNTLLDDATAHDVLRNSPLYLFCLSPILFGSFTTGYYLGANSITYPMYWNVWNAS